MEYTKIPKLDEDVSRVALGTWAIGGWMWGGTDEEQSIRTVHAALDKGVNIVDTAPVYGFGRSEEIVGKALAEDGKRQRVLLATKAGLAWDTQSGDVWRNSSPERIYQEVEDSLRRLQTDTLDICQIHWPDPIVPLADTAGALEELRKQGKVRAVGVSNFGPEQIREFSRECNLSTCQPPYNVFEREIEKDILPYCQKNGIALLTYGALCRGLLTGKMNSKSDFPGDDLRNVDPKFQEPRFSQYLKAVDILQSLAREEYGRDVLHLAVRFVLDKGINIALWGGRRSEQMEPLDQVFGWQLVEKEMQEIDKILSGTVTDPVGPEFMAPPSRQ